MVPDFHRSQPDDALAGVADFRTRFAPITASEEFHLALKQFNMGDCSNAVRGAQ